MDHSTGFFIPVSDVNLVAATYHGQVSTRIL